MNRKWLVGGVAFLAVAAVLALVIGSVVGRSIVPSATPPQTPAVEPPAPTGTERFKDTLTDISIAYPASWERRLARDPAVRLVVASPDESAAVSISVRKLELEAVTPETLELVRPLTDDLLREDDRIETVPEPVAVSVDGLPGYRYTYTYRTEAGQRGAHIHYFLFKEDRLIQMVFQAVPASKLASLQPTFEEIAESFDKGD